MHWKSILSRVEVEMIVLTVRFIEDADADSDEARAERGEGGSRLGMKRRESWRGEGRSGRWNESGDRFELQDRRPGVSRRSVSRQSK